MAKYRLGPKPRTTPLFHQITMVERRRMEAMAGQVARAEQRRAGGDAAGAGRSGERERLAPDHPIWQTGSASRTASSAYPRVVERTGAEAT